MQVLSQEAIRYSICKRKVRQETSLETKLTPHFLAGLYLSSTGFKAEGIKNLMTEKFSVPQRCRLVQPVAQIVLTHHLVWPIIPKARLEKTVFFIRRQIKKKLRLNLTEFNSVISALFHYSNIYCLTLISAKKGERRSWLRLQSFVCSNGKAWISNVRDKIHREEMKN